VARALRAIDYQGWVVAETFAGRIPEIAAATSIWRDDRPSDDAGALGRRTLAHSADAWHRRPAPSGQSEEDARAGRGLTARPSRV
jgi:hypothetical protein